MVKNSFPFFGYQKLAHQALKTAQYKTQGVLWGGKFVSNSELQKLEEKCFVLCLTLVCFISLRWNFFYKSCLE